MTNLDCATRYKWIVLAAMAKQATPSTAYATPKVFRPAPVTK